jgi:hypothetical protein
MEASEKQLDLTHGGRANGTVRVLENRLVIESLTITDERAAGLVRERAEAGQDAGAVVADAIEVGARVMRREGSELDLEHARAEFDRATQHSLEEFGKQADEVVKALDSQLAQVFSAEEGVLTRTLDGFGDELGEQIARNFDGERATAVQHQVRELVAKALEDRFQGFARQFFAEDGTGPLAGFKAGIDKTVVQAVRHLQAEERSTREKLDSVRVEVTRLTEQAEKRRALAEAEAAGTRKGRSFEDRVHDALERIANGRGDCARHVGDQRGEGGSKKGDTVIEVGAADGPCLGRIVIEAKDERLSRNEAWDQLNGAMQEREADYAVLIVAGEENVPARREQLVEYEGNKLIAAVDPEHPDELGLDLAYRYARLRVLMSRDRALEVDAAGVRDAAEAARSALKRAQSVRLALTNIDKSTSKARDGLEGIVADVESELARIELLIAAAEPAD